MAWEMDEGYEAPKEQTGWVMKEGYEAPEDDTEDLDTSDYETEIIKPEGDRSSAVFTGLAEDTSMDSKETRDVYMEENEAIKQESQGDISSMMGKAEQASMTMGDRLGMTDDAKEARAESTQTIATQLKDMGYTLENRGGEKVITDDRGNEYEYSSSMVDDLISAKFETGGAVAGGIAGAELGATAGSVFGPVGTGIGGVLGGLAGGAAGAMAGDVIDTEGNREEMGLAQLTSDERQDRAIEVGTADAVAGAVGGAVLSGLGKILSPKTIKAFTSIADMPNAERRAVKHLAQKSGLSLDAMEKKILDYADSTKVGKITDRSAVEGAAKSSEKEQTGFITEAMGQSDTGKAKVLNETTKRAEIVEDALKQMDDELETNAYSRAFARHTLDDEGRRKATDWKGLAKTLKNMNIDENDAIYQRVLENAETFGTKETEIFQRTVRPAKPEEKAIEAIQPFTETTRASVGSQFGATGIGMVDRLLTRIIPNADTKTVNVIKKAMEEVKNPKELNELLVREGIDEAKARQIVSALDNMAKAQEIEDVKVGKSNAIDDKKTIKEYESTIKDLGTQFSKSGKAKAAQQAKETKAAEVLATKEAKVRETEYGRMADAEADAIENTKIGDQLNQTKSRDEAKEIARQTVENDAYEWSTANPLKGIDNKMHNTLLKRVNDAKNPQLREKAMKELIDFRGQMESRIAKEAAKAPSKETAGATASAAEQIEKPDPMKLGLADPDTIGTQTKMDLEPSLFDEPAPKKVKPLEGKGFEENDVLNTNIGELKGKQQKLDLGGTPDDNPAAIRSKYAKKNTPIGRDSDEYRQEGEDLISGNARRNQEIDTQKAKADEIEVNNKLDSQADGKGLSEDLDSGFESAMKKYNDNPGKQEWGNARDKSTTTIERGEELLETYKTIKKDRPRYEWADHLEKSLESGAIDLKDVQKMKDSYEQAPGYFDKILAGEKRAKHAPRKESFDMKDGIPTTLTERKAKANEKLKEYGIELPKSNNPVRDSFRRGEMTQKQVEEYYGTTGTKIPNQITTHKKWKKDTK